VLILDPRRASASYSPVRRPVVDSCGPAKPPEKRKVGGSTPPLTTTTYVPHKAPHLHERDEAPFSCLRLATAVHGYRRLVAPNTRPGQLGNLRSQGAPG
jgi:hypothetical protein